MGGADPQNMSLTVVRAVRSMRVPHLDVRVVLGEANPHRQSILTEVGASNSEIEVLSGVRNMAQQIAWSDLAVTAAGVTLWESLAMGCPTLTWPRYPADVKVLTQLTELGAVLLLPASASAESIASSLSIPLNNKKKRLSMSAAGRAIVDCHGPQRVIEALTRTIANSDAPLEVRAQ
jgi:spore coat polysaccharide biosynthesis predicted glycosyltransferase SpsG